MPRRAGGAPPRHLPTPPGPPNGSPLSDSPLHGVVAAAAAELERVVAAVPTGDWTRMTPCDLTVREVVDHVVAGNVFAVRLLGGATAAEAVAGLDADQLGDDPVGAVHASCARQSEAFAAVPAGRVLHHPSGDIDVPTFVRFRAGDLLVHAWDVASGAGLATDLAPDAVAGLWAMVEPHVEEMRASGVYGDGASGSLPPDASVQARLLDAFGRRPV